jgi:restriction system protein
MKNIWFIRSNGGEWLPFFIENNCVALGWDKTPDFSGKDRKFIKQSLLKNYPENEKSISSWAGYFESFVNVIQKNDYVLSYDTSSRVYHLGKIIGDYEYNSTKNPEWPHIRKVEWFKKTISRDLIPSNVKNSLGSPQTLSKLSNESADVILKIYESKKTIDSDLERIEKENQDFSETLLENAKESLKDKIQSLSPDEMEDLVKEILNAMGYIAKRTKKGSDRGVDVFASKDGLGLEEPRIFAEVKHRKEQIGAPEIRSFLGGRKPSDKCIYVSTGSFSKEARYEAERSTIPLTLLDIDELSNLVSLHYDNFTVEGKSLLPLKKVYIPI